MKTQSANSSLSGATSKLVIGVAIYSCVALKPLAAQTAHFEPNLGYLFYEEVADGTESSEVFTTGTLVDSGYISGSDLNRKHSIVQPNGTGAGGNHLSVFANANGTSFWTSAVSPITEHPLPPGQKYMGASELGLTYAFRKDSETAALDFKISKLDLFASGPLGAPTNNKGLYGDANFELITLTGGYEELQYQFLEASVTGRPGDFRCDSDGLALTESHVDNGVLSSTRCELSAPVSMSVDLSDIRVGGVFVLEYKAETNSVDTIQFDTTVRSFGRDPLDPDAGVALSYEGVTPIAIETPEIRTPVILSPVSVSDTDLGTPTRRHHWTI